MGLMKKRVCLSQKHQTQKPPILASFCTLDAPLPPSTQPQGHACICSDYPVLPQGQTRTLLTNKHSSLPLFFSVMPLCSNAWWGCTATRWRCPYKIGTERAAGSRWCALAIPARSDLYEHVFCVASSECFLFDWSISWCALRERTKIMDGKKKKERKTEFGKEKKKRKYIYICICIIRNFTFPFLSLKPV